jgi:cytoskeleton protein RodZ
VKKTEPEAEASSGDYSSGVGALLKASRQRLDQELRHVADSLRIRLVYLQAIEDGRFHDLPGSTYAAGFIRTYAEYLGLDGAEVVRRYRQEAAGASGRPELHMLTPVSERHTPSGAIMLVALVVAVLAYGGWYYVSSQDKPVSELAPELSERLSSIIKPATEKKAEVAEEVVPVVAIKSSEPVKPVEEVKLATVADAPKIEAPKTETPKVDSPKTETPKIEAPKVEATKIEPPATKPVEKPVEKVETPAPAPTLAPAPPPAAAAPAPTTPPPPAAETQDDKGRIFGHAEGNERIALEANSDAWIEVRGAKGELIFSRVLRKGDRYRVAPQPGMILGTGNAGAINVTVDGHSAPSLGSMGSVRKGIPLDPEKLKDGLPAR